MVAVAAGCRAGFGGDPMNSEARQPPALLPGMEDLGLELLTIEQRKTSGVHNGSSLAADERRRDVALELLALGVAKDRIARLVSCSISTLVELERRAQSDLRAVKKSIAAEARAAAHLQIRRLLERPDDVPLSQAAITAAIMLDKSLLLDGDPNSIHEARASQPMRHEDINAWIRNLPAAAPANDAVIDVSQDSSPQEERP